ncbi:MAG: class I SAM-dependent methyltransferase [Sporichthyaceae bacterium]
MSEAELATPPPSDEEFAAQRPWYAEQIAGGIERFLEPRRTTCPWCGSDRLKTRVRTSDILQRKPGVFTMDECKTCRHVFQNPRLNGEGLGFYYRDFYDGLGASRTEGIFAAHRDLYLSRAQMVAPYLTPKNWLDIGCGFGHFSKDAAEVWPDTEFDGLDMGAGVEEGQRRGWLKNVYRGELPDLADQVAGKYDVLSMHHYLEHVTDPRAELDTVARIMRPGSYLLIEVPDPTSITAKIFGKLWTPYFQPQHLNLIPSRNLLQALVERGITPVEVQRKEAHIPIDLTCAVLSITTMIAPDPRFPWLREPKPSDYKRQEKVWKVAPHVLKWAWKVDQWTAPIIRNTDGGNAYRVLARRD